MCVQAMSWVDGYECYNTNDVDSIAGSSEADHPILVLLAHDGDNAFGGGYSYYEQCVKDFVDDAQKKVSLCYNLPLIYPCVLHLHCMAHTTLHRAT